MCNLADVQQTVFAWQQVNQCPEIQYLGHRTFVDFANFNFSCYFFNAAFGFVGFRRFCSRNGDGAIFADVDLATCFFSQSTNHRAALANHITDFFWIDFEGVQLRRKAGDFSFGFAHGFLHFAQNVDACFFGLCQCHLHDFFGNALDFDVHLQSSDTVGGTSHFKVHIAQMIFVAQNIGQHRKTVAVFDQTHCNTCNVRFQRHASIHQ